MVFKVSILFLLNKINKVGGEFNSEVALLNK